MKTTNLFIAQQCDQAGETVELSTDSQPALAPKRELTLTEINELAVQYCGSYASPHYITFSVQGLQRLINAANEAPTPPPAQATSADISPCPLQRNCQSLCFHCEYFNFGKKSTRV